MGLETDYEQNWIEQLALLSIQFINLSIYFQAVENRAFVYLHRDG
jgi:hypothetical protein